MATDKVAADKIQDRTAEKPYGEEGSSGNNNQDGYSDAALAAGKDKLSEDPEGVHEGTAPKIMWEYLEGHRNGTVGYEAVDAWNSMNKELGGTCQLSRPSFP